VTLGQEHKLKSQIYMHHFRNCAFIILKVKTKYEHQGLLTYAFSSSKLRA